MDSLLILSIVNGQEQMDLYEVSSRIAILHDTHSFFVSVIYNIMSIPLCS